MVANSASGASWTPALDGVWGPWTATPTAAGGGPGIDTGVLSPSPSPSLSRKPSPKPSQSAVVDVVRVSASRGDCWLEVRRDGPDGRILYSDTLTRGKTKLVHGSELHLRWHADELRLLGRERRIGTAGHRVQ